MFRFGETEVEKEKLYGTERSVNIRDVNFENMVISRLIERKTNSKYFDWIFR